MGGCYYKQAGRKVPKNDTFYILGEYFDFSGLSWNWKQNEVVSHSLNPDSSGVVAASFLLWARVLLSDEAKPLSICLLSLSQEI